MPPRATRSDLTRLRGLRAVMDEINGELARSVVLRALLAGGIARFKARIGLPATDRVRERAMLRKVLAGAPRGLPRRDLERVFRAIFAASRGVAVRATRGRTPSRRRARRA